MKFYFNLLALMVSISSFAQNQMSGKIISKQTAEPISANIYFPQLEKGTISDLDGNYIITQIPNGTFTLVVSAIGYASQTLKVSFENDTKLLNLEMEETAVEMEEVIISTPFHRLQSENVMRIERVSAEKMRQTGAPNLGEGLKNIPGVDLISTGIGIGKPVIRGLSSNRVLIYSQGIRLENQQFGEEHGLGLNDSGIESVEVIKGPASLLYGSDALGGVLYFNPERFARSAKLEADWNSRIYSNTLGISTNAGAKKSWNKFRMLARIGIDSHSDYKTGEGYRVTNSRFSEKDFKTGFQYSGIQSKTTLRYNYTRTTPGIPDELLDNSRSKKPLLPNQEVNNHILSLENKWFFGNSHLNTTLGYLVNDRKEFEEEDAKTPELAMTLRTFNYDIKYHFPEQHNFQTIVGIQGLIQSNKNYGDEILIPDADIADIGILATTHYHLEKFDFQGGIRFDNRQLHTFPTLGSDKLTRSFNSFTAAVGAKANLIRDLVLRLNLANGFRAPNLAELASEGVHEGTYRYERGNEALENEKNLQLDVSLEFRSGHFEVAFNSFYNSISNYIFLSPTSENIEGFKVYEYLQDHAFLYGGEFGLHLHPHPWDWLHWKSNFETVIGQTKDGQFLPLLPAASLTNTIRVEKEKFPTAFLSLKNVFNQNKVSEFETRSGGYSLLNAGIEDRFTFRKTKVTVGLSATNLTNKKYISHLSRFKENEFWNMGRNFVLRIGFEI